MLHSTYKFGDRGFTLIEMLIVVVIIGILAAIILPRTSGSSRTARINVCQKSINTIDGTLEMIVFKNNYDKSAILGYFPTGNITTDLGCIPVAKLQEYFAEGGIHCLANSGGAAQYYISNGMVDATYGAANHEH